MSSSSARGAWAATLATGALGREERMALVARVHSELLEAFQPAALAAMSREQITREIGVVMDSVLASDARPLPQNARQRVISEVYDEVHGYGPIQPLVQDATLTEIMVNGPKQVYAERDGQLFITDIVFRDDAHVMRIIDRIVSPLGRRIDEASPLVDARLPDGSRVNAIIPPLSVIGPCLNIRKFSRDPYTAQDLINFGTMTPGMTAFLKACVIARLNMVISGGTGSGKTTTLNVLSQFIPESERIVTIEDAAELRLHQEHVVRLESRPPNIEGKGEITIRQLVRNSLRMRPDRIIVGEARGGEALDMLQAMNTGHDGSLSTAHTNSPRDTLSRLETMVLMAGMDLPSRAIREQIASAINVIVHQERFHDGSRKVTHISEVQGMEGDVVVLQDLFLFERQGIDKDGKVTGHFRPTGLRPKFLPRLLSRGLSLPPDLFSPHGGGQ